MLNTVVAVVAFLAVPEVAADTRQWYTLGGALIFNVMFGDLIFIMPVLDWVRLDILFLRRIRAPRQKTQLDMDRTYDMPAGLYLAYRLQLAGKFVVICAMFGSAIPVL